MNKKLLTIALAAAMVAPVVASADTTLYGRIDNALVRNDNGSNTYWDIAHSASSRFGLKGSEDLGNGLKAIFQYEWALNSSENLSSTDNGTETIKNRLAYVGVAGGFGTLAIGRQWTPYYGSVDKTDVFNAPSSTAGTNGYYLGLSRVGEALAYISPNFNGFSAKLAMVISGGTGSGTSDGVDAYNLSLDYNNGPLSVGFSWLDYDSALETTDADRWGLAGKYNFGNFAIMAQYENKDDLAGTPNSGADSYALAAEAYFGNNTVRAVYGNEDPDGATDEDTWALGFQHNFSKRTRVYVEYANNDNGSAADTDSLAIGLRHDF